MTDNSEIDAVNFPVAGNEIESLLGALERNRRTLAWKCGGLDAAGMRATLGPSSVTLGGLLKHLALVEDDSFSGSLLGHDLGSPWDGVDWDADPDWEWQSAADDTPEQLMALWREAVFRSRAAVAEALAKPDVKKRLGDAGFTPVAAPSAAFADLIARDLVKWSRVVKDAGLTAE